MEYKVKIISILQTYWYDTVALTLSFTLALLICRDLLREDPMAKLEIKKGQDGIYVPGLATVQVHSVSDVNQVRRRSRNKALKFQFGKVRLIISKQVACHFSDSV